MRGNVIGLFVVAVMCASCVTTAAPARKGTELPKVLHGVWEAGVTTCKYPGNPDSDSRIVISGKKVEGYEDWSEVLEVTRLNDKPFAWKIRARLHIHEDISEEQSVFVLSASDNGNLVIVDESRPEIYVRCL